MEWVALAALSLAAVACVLAWSLHKRLRELEEHEEECADEHFRRTSLLFD